MGVSERKVKIRDHISIPYPIAVFTIPVSSLLRSNSSVCSRCLKHEVAVPHLCNLTHPVQKTIGSKVIGHQNKIDFAGIEPVIPGTPPSEYLWTHN